MQKELGEILGKGCKLPRYEHEIEGQFRRYYCELKVLHGRDFKKRLYQFRQKHPEVDISDYSINSVLRIVQLILYILASIAAVLNIIDHVHNLLIK
ncbi:MAG TPA: hypothetical protein VGR54_05545 [Nitrosopumilaceae archaeon]|nr:hypothetical protein [Nitrosopumilaceae archaeon]